jgi:hypothetical protein
LGVRCGASSPFNCPETSATGKPKPENWITGHEGREEIKEEEEEDEEFELRRHCN